MVSVGAQHLLHIPIAGWGNVRPQVDLILSMLEASPSLVITTLADRRAARRINGELALYPNLKRIVDARLRVITVVKPRGPELNDHQQDEISQEMADNIGHHFNGLFGTTEEGRWSGAPGCVLMDVMKAQTLLKPLLSSLRENGLAGRTKIFFHLPGLATSFAPIVKTWAETDNADAVPSALSPWLDYEAIHDVPGVPRFKTFEQYPQIGSRSGDKDHSLAEGHNFRMMFKSAVRAVDGFMYPGTPEIEPAAAAFVAENARVQVLVSGYSGRDAPAAETIPKRVNNEHIPTDDGSVIPFLDECEKKFGKRSVAYLSFGSFMWPVHRIELIEWLIDSLLTAVPPIPFILSATAPEARIPDPLMKRIEESGLGKVFSWVPQRSILYHQAIAFYLCHMGIASTYEAIAAGMALVMIPQFGDQPGNSMVLEQAGAGILLRQFNTGNDGRVRCDGVTITSTRESVQQEMADVFSRVRGEEGDRMRAAVWGLRDKVKASHERGAARKDIERLVEMSTIVPASS